MPSAPAPSRPITRAVPRSSRFPWRATLLVAILIALALLLAFGIVLYPARHALLAGAADLRRAQREVRAGTVQRSPSGALTTVIGDVTRAHAQFTTAGDRLSLVAPVA